MPNLQQSTFVVAASLGLGCVFFAAFFIFFSSPPTRAQTAAVMEAAALSVALDPNTIEGKSAIIYDPTTQRVLFAKSAEVPLPLASLTKLMTAYVVLQNKSPLSTVTIALPDLAPEGDWGFHAGDQITINDLLKFGLVASSNDAMAAAANALGSEYLTDMNAAAAKLGLTHTYFLNSTGLDLDLETSGAYGSAHDVALLASAFLARYPQFFELSSVGKVSIVSGGRMLNADATDAPLLDIPGFIGAKTGYTDLAGGNLVAAFDLEPGHPVVVVVLGSSTDGRFTDIRTLVNAAHAAH